MSEKIRISEYKGFELWDCPTPEGWTVNPYPVQVTANGEHVNVFADTNDAMKVIDGMDASTVAYHMRTSTPAPNTPPETSASKRLPLGGDEDRRMYADYVERVKNLGGEPFSYEQWFGSYLLALEGNGKPVPPENAHDAGDVESQLDSFDYATAMLGAELAKTKRYDMFDHHFKALDQWKTEALELEATQAQRIRDLETALAASNAALEAIATNPHIEYAINEQSDYGKGVTDGHRFCADIARKAQQATAAGDGGESEGGGS